MNHQPPEHQGVDGALLEAVGDLGEAACVREARAQQRRVLACVAGLARGAERDVAFLSERLDVRTQDVVLGAELRVAVEGEA